MAAPLGYGQAPSGSIHDLSIVELAPRLTQASLMMEVHGRAGQALYDFEVVYTLAETRTGWRIAAIAHNQIPRLDVNPASERLRPPSVADVPTSSATPVFA